MASGNDNADELKLELKESISEVGKLKEKMATKDSAQMQHELFVRRCLSMMEGMQQQIDELKGSSVRREVAAGPEKLEFCCANCKVVHNRDTCPVCGSQLRRIFEGDSTGR